MQRPFSSYPNAIPTGLEASPILRSDFVGAYSAGPSTTEVQEAERKKEVHTEPLYNILCWRIFVFSLLYFVISLELDGEWTVKSRRISFGSDAKWGRSFEEFHSSFAGGRTCFTAPPLHTKEREQERDVPITSFKWGGRTPALRNPHWSWSPSISKDTRVLLTVVCDAK